MQSETISRKAFKELDDLDKWAEGIFAKLHAKSENYELVRETKRYEMREWRPGRGGYDIEDLGEATHIVRICFVSSTGAVINLYPSRNGSYYQSEFKPTMTFSGLHAIGRNKRHLSRASDIHKVVMEEVEAREKAEREKRQKEIERQQLLVWLKEKFPEAKIDNGGYVSGDSFDVEFEKIQFTVDRVKGNPRILHVYNMPIDIMVKLYILLKHGDNLSINFEMPSTSMI